MTANNSTIKLHYIQGICKNPHGNHKTKIWSKVIWKNTVMIDIELRKKANKNVNLVYMCLCTQTVFSYKRKK